jgi:Domain of unknown function (DUF4397)
MFESLHRPDLAIALAAALASSGCGGSSGSSSSSSMPPSAVNAQVRFVDGAPSLETIVAGSPRSICSPSSPCYLRVNGQTVTYRFFYGSITNFMPLSAGVHSMRALDTTGYFVGPLKTTSLAAGKSYTLVVVGTYPNYQVLTFEEPDTNAARLTLYEAAPTVPDIDFGRFDASSGSGFERLGSAHFGNVVTVSLGESVSDFGGYAGHGTQPLNKGALTVANVNSFDAKNELPFHNAGRLSLFLFDPVGSNGPGVFGSLDP